MPSKSAKQAKFMRAVAHSPKFAKKVGVSQKVGKEFEMADKKKRKFADGGSSKYDERYKRKIADIEKDFAKASKGKTGKAADVAKAKYEQRMADAKDDLAKWTKSDRTQTRAAEKSAERNLSMTRKFGAMKSATEKDVGETARVSAPTDVVKAPSIDRSFMPKSKAKTKPAPKTAAKPASRATAPAAEKKAELPAAFKNTKGSINLPPAPAKKQAAPAEKKPVSSNMRRDAFMSLGRADDTDRLRASFKNLERERKLSQMAAAARAPGASQFAKDRYRMAKESNQYAKGGTVKKPMPKEGATGSSSTVPMTPERKAFLKRMQAEEAASKKGVKPNPSKYAKGGKMADKAGRALKKKSADTMGRAMMKKAGGGKCYAKGGSVSSRADGIAKKGKTKGKIC